MISEQTPPKLTRNEGLKSGSPLLTGTIAPTLADSTKDRFSDDDYEFLKFHGIYQGDDRDKRKTGKQYIYMVRGRLPGGAVSAPVYLAFDKLCTEYANNTLRITTRQGFQFHGVTKGGLGKLMRGIHDAMATTIAACGDVNRNVMAAPTPATSAHVNEVQRHAKEVSDALLPKTRAYYQIWVEGTELNLTDEDANFVDPLYGKTYLPRKFKVAFAIPPSNDIDVFTNDLGFIAIIEQGKLVGYNMAAGGGLGMSSGNAQTYPRLADVIGFVTPDQVILAAKAVVTIHRDFGDRTNRKHARLKYVMEEKGVDWFRQELEKRIGFQLAPAKPYEFTKQGDVYGWQTQFDGNYFLGLFVENGRIKDDGSRRLKSGLRAVFEKFQPEARLTPSQNILLINVKQEDRDGINKILAEHGIAVENQAGPVRRASIACPALPTCGLALAEAERLAPDVLTRIEGLLAEVGLKDEEIIVRMTGCPNGCARPYMAELALVGRAPGKYQVYIGGNESGTRLVNSFKDNVKNDDLVNELRPLFTRFAQERIAGSGSEIFAVAFTRRKLPQPLRPNQVQTAIEPPPALSSPEEKLTARDVAALNEQFSRLGSEAALAWAWERFGMRAAIGTSFQGAGLVMIDLAKKAGLKFPAFTLDTGLLFPETLELKKRLEDFFGIAIESLAPDLTVEQQAEAQGPELWKRDPDLCCTMRKVLPLQGKLRDLSCWITGLRRQQSDGRAGIGVVELYALDAETDIVKLNPMANWKREEIWEYIKSHRIPYNPLHDQGYRSIGCRTCTVKAGEGGDERAGRWTGFKKVECGIHTFMPKKLDFQI